MNHEVEAYVGELGELREIVSKMRSYMAQEPEHKRPKDIKLKIEKHFLMVNFNQENKKKDTK